MRKVLLLIQKMPRRIPPRRLAVLLFLGALGMVGLRSFTSHPSTPAKPQAPDPQKGTTAAGDFGGMRPRKGDHMTPPRIGFRWKFDLQKRSGDSSPSQASMMPSFFNRSDSTDAQGIKYVLHVVGPGGQEITRETAKPNLRLNLKKNDLPPGECEWWVEACVPGLPPVASPREHFVLKP
jgi:hypothetical protein